MQPAWRYARHPAPATTIHRSVAQNLARTLTNYALASSSGTASERPGLTLVSSGIRYSVFNAAVLTEPVITTAEELTSRIVTAGSFYIRLGMPWSCWVCRDHLSPQTRTVADLLFQRHRLRFIAEHAGMEASKLLPATRQLPALDIRPVSTAETRRDFTSVTGEAFQLPIATSRQIYDGPGLWAGSYRGYVGYVGGRAVSTAATCSGPEGVGLYSVATAFAYRGRGYAEAITRAVVQIATERSGVQRTVLQSTAAGLELYERLGYRRVTSILVYASV